MRTELVLVAIAALAAAERAADASCVPGFDYAVFAKQKIHIENNCDTDSYNSANGPYTSGGCNGNLGTNGSIALENSTTVCGSAATSGGSVSTANTATYVPPVKTIGDITLDPVTVPSYPSGGSATWSNNGTHVVAPNTEYTTLGCTGNNTVVQLSKGDYVASTVLFSKCNVQLTSGPVVIYVKSGGTLNFTNGAKLNVPSSTGKPTDLIFMVASSEDINLEQGGTTLYGAIYAPKAAIHVNNQVNVYGALVGGGSEVHIEQHSAVHYDEALASLEIAGFTCEASEISRATPIVTTISGQSAIVQGTFESPIGTKKTIASTADVASFAFPYIKGHMRARTTASISTSSSDFSAGTVLFDAGASGKIPSPNNSGCSSFDGSCRNLFTVTQTPDSNGLSFHPDRVQFKDSNASTLGALIAPTTAVTGITSTHWQTIVRTVLAGKLGGVDRSTVAVIPASPLAGTSTRPTIAYFGATDGMLHAVCASTGGTTETDTNICPSLGTELWAFMPRVQLPLVRSNSTRVDGSVRVVDAFGDFNNPATGTRSFRTILTFQTGYADTTVGANAAVYALDVTDPANPIVLWEYTKPSTAGSAELGVGLALAAGPVLINSKPTNLVVAETNNAGTGGTGVVATALNMETGAKVWQFSYLYPSPPRSDSSALPLPTNGIPGGAVGVDLTRQGYTTDIAMGDLYGNLWRLDAATGTSKTGTGVPLFQFSTNKKPIGAMPAIYGDSAGSQYAAFTSGGYADPSSASWVSGTQKLIAIDLQAAGPYPIAETATTKLAVVEDLGSGERGYAQVLVVGNELFAVTDSSDVNSSSFGTAGDTGHVLRYDLDAGSSSTVVVRGGAGSLAASETTLYSSSSDRQQQLSTDATSTVGTSVDSAVLPKLVRRLWLRTQ